MCFDFEQKSNLLFFVHFFNSHDKYFLWSFAIFLFLAYTKHPLIELKVIIFLLVASLARTEPFLFGLFII